MTVSVILAGLIPILFRHGDGPAVMKRIAAPMVCGVVIPLILERGGALPKTSVVNVSQVFTVDKSDLAEKIGSLRVGDLKCRPGRGHQPAQTGHDGDKRAGGKNIFRIFPG